MIGERIAKARKQAGYSDQKSFSIELKANGFKVSPRTLADYELNNSEPKISTVKEIARICKVSFNWLIDGKGDPQLDDSGISNYGHSARADELTEKEIIALLPKDQQMLVKSYRKLSDSKKKVHRESMLIEAANTELEDE